MVTHLKDFERFLGKLPSRDRYLRFLQDVADVSGKDITPRTLRSDEDVEAFAERLASHYSEKSIANYRSVMRRYVDMVEELGL